MHWEGLKEAIAHIDNLSKLTKTKAAVKSAAIFLEGKLKDYPTASHRPNPLIRLDPKVRRGFFYHLKKGDIEVPYRRGMSPSSEKLGQSWNVRTENQGFRAIIGTSVSYAQLVQASEKQTSYHRRTGWITTKQTMLLYGPQAVDMIATALRSEVNSGQ